MRKVEYVDKMEVEWDAFTREMKQETNVKTNKQTSFFLLIIFKMFSRKI